MSHVTKAISNFLTVVLLALGLSFVLAAPQSLAAQERVMLILDSSGSMWGQVEGVNKHLIAREVIGNMLGEIGENVNMGVMAYGHRRKGDCKDIQTLIPVGPVDARKYMNRIERIQPRGKTPISAAVRRAAEELKYTEEKTTIVLVSDGLETCDADPCALSSELEKLGIDFTVHVVGFDLGNEDTETLSCLAENTGGVFLQASNANELTDAIGKVVETVKEPEPEPEPEPVIKAEPEPEPEPEPVAGPTLTFPRAYLVEGGERLDKAYFRVYGAEKNTQGKRTQITYGGGKPKFELPPGKYYITAKHGEVLAGVDVEIEAGKENIVEIVLNAGLVRPVAYLADGIEPLSDAYFRVYTAGSDTSGKRKQLTYGSGKPVFTVPAGPHHITAKRGEALTGLDVDIVAGEVHKVHIVMNAGVIIPKAFWTDGGEAVKDAYFRVFKTAQNADGKREQVTYGGGKPKFTVAAGEYYITAKVGDARASQTIAVAPGEATEVALIMGAGIVRPSAHYTEGGDAIKKAYFRVYEDQENADGQRREITRGAGKPKFKLPEGVYYITAQIGDAVVGKTVAVEPGQSTDLALILDAGVVIPTAHYAEGEDPIRKAYFRVYEPQANAEGKRKEITRGSGAPKFKLPAGAYYITAETGDARIGKEIEVKGGETIEVALVLGAGVLVPTAYYAEGGDQVKKAYYRVYAPEVNAEGKRKEITRGGGTPKFKLPAGKYYVTAKIGEAVIGQDVEVLAGQSNEVALVANVGILALFASAAEGGDPVNKVYFRVFEAKKNIEGNRKKVTSSGGKPKFNLPAGKYFVTVKWGEATASQEVEVVAGELKELTLVLNAGRMVVEAVDADGQQVTKGLYFRIFAAKKDIEGKRKQLSGGGGKSLAAALPAGDYFVQVSLGGRNKIAGTQDVVVKAGELTEIKVTVTAKE